MTKLLLASVFLISACTASPQNPPQPQNTSPQPPAAVSTVTAPKSCPVTKTRPFVAPSGQDATQLFGSDSAVGNDELWAGGLGTNGVFTRYQPLEPDGSMSRKIGWSRLVPGTLTITGRRLDANAPPLKSNVPEGYGVLGFQSSLVNFPTPGCWEITGRTETTSLTFIVYADFS